MTMGVFWDSFVEGRINTTTAIINGSKNKNPTLNGRFEIDIVLIKLVIG